MILFRTKGDWKWKFDPPNQSKEAYAKVLLEFRQQVRPSMVSTIDANGMHLVEILDRISGIPRPQLLQPNQSFIWVGVFAETIVANILNALYNDDSFIIQQVQDIHDYNDQQPRTC